METLRNIQNDLCRTISGHDVPNDSPNNGTSIFPSNDVLLLSWIVIVSDAGFSAVPASDEVETEVLLRSKEDLYNSA